MLVSLKKYGQVALWRNINMHCITLDNQLVTPSIDMIDNEIG